MTDHSHNVMLTVGIGEQNTVALSIAVDSNIVANLAMTKLQAQNHVRVLQRHIDLLPDLPEATNEVSQSRN